MNQPSIKIEGPSMSGKSALAWAIQETLKQYGIVIKVTGCEDEEPYVMDKTWENRLKKLKNKIVVVNTKRK